MKRLLDVRPVGFCDHLPGDPRSPESFAFPACLTSLMEFLGEDVGLETIRAHDTEYLDRFAYKETLAASGMSFGLLWHPQQCPSCFDLTQVNDDHDDGIRRAFDYAGWGCEILEHDGTNTAELRAAILGGIDAGFPVLAFGVVGPPECAIICGYDEDGRVLYGYSHFQSQAPGDCLENGMFIASDWESSLWKIVRCTEKKTPARDLRPIVEHGVGILARRSIDGYLAGEAAYDAWIDYLGAEACETMDEDELRRYYEFHHSLVGNHAEARCYLASFLYARAADDQTLQKAAGSFMDIHETCWRVWGVCGGIGAPDGHLRLRDAAARGELAALIRTVKALDRRGADALAQWLREH